MHPGNPGQDPYGAQPSYGDPTAPPPSNPYAPPPANPYAPPPANPYAAPTGSDTPPADPYAPSAPPADPYGQQPPADPYAPPASGQPYDPYAPGTPSYGQPYPPSYGQPYPPPYAPQPYGGAPMYPHAGFIGPGGQQNTLGLISMILGIASIPLNCCFLGIPLGLAAVITGWLGKQKADQGLAGNAGQALAGLICGAVGLLLGLLYILLTVVTNAVAPLQP
ncbi:hypothetical protein Jiend_37130 [Micromonospora endophytica]|nr:DUF4190 domain-containing protein [Micromonospora endophytica]RIW43650.1 DUF4190 domain-containing protein [Micromonospora endophytica]BCJ60291.1 hypothetical protein Jiend_37130 [Micromonospora endophytica]